MGREDFIRQILNSKEYKILDRLANEADAPVGDAVQQIVDMTMSALPKHQPATRGGPGDIDYNVSLALLELGQTLDPSRHGKLVEFLSELQKKTAVDPSTGKPVDIQGDVLWTGLPSFGYTELETWDERGGEYKDPCDPAMDPEQKLRWVRLNAFTARVSQAAQVEYPPPGADMANLHPMDKSLRAIWTIQIGLENGKHPPEKLVDTAALQAVCAWFIYAAERLWANVLNHRKFNNRASGAGPGSKQYEERKWLGFERDRWDVWMQGLRDAKAACADDEVRKMIEDALANAERVMGG